MLKRTLVWRTRHRNVHTRGNNAFVTFYVTRHVQFGSTVFKKNERGSYVLRKIDGKWLIVAQHISAFPPMLKFQQTAEKQGRDPDDPNAFNLNEYYDRMEQDIAVYDPASPWIYDGKEKWVKRVEQMQKIRQFLDLNQFNRTEVEWDDMKVVTVDREIRRPEGSFTERNHGRITWVYLKQPDGEWFYWHDHTSEIPEDFSYQR
jgi:ketosteroid isomerase-like protein